MTTTPAPIELSQSELREVASYAVSCARLALAIFELAEALKAREAKSGRKIVRLPPREVTLDRKAS